MLQRAEDLIDFVVWQYSANLYRRHRAKKKPVLSSQTQADQIKWELFKCKQYPYLQIKLNLSCAGWNVLSVLFCFFLLFSGLQLKCMAFFRWLYRFNAKTVAMATYQVWKGAFPPPHTFMPGIGHGVVMCDGSYSSLTAVKTIRLDDFHLCHHYLPIWSLVTHFT